MTTSSDRARHGTPAPGAPPSGSTPPGDAGAGHDQPHGSSGHTEGDVVARATGATGPNEVTRSGPTEQRGAEQALTGQAGGRRSKRGDKNAVVPDAEFTSYYGRPVLKASPWELDIPAYLFMGGVAAGSSLLSAGADLSDRPALRRTGRVGSIVALTLSLVALVHDLGRPARFHHMLRVAKPTSPMSMGTWVLTAYGPFAGLAAASEMRGLLPRRLRTGLVGRLLGLSGRPAGLVAAAVAPAVASYTAVLLSDTATPTWHDSHQHLPFVFVGSAAAASGGLGMIGAPVEEAAPARRLAVGGALLELAVERRMEQAMGLTAEPLHLGHAGTLMKASRALTIGGTLGTLLLGGRSRLGAAASGAALMAGSACLRFGVFEAGQASARDPKYTVVPQRQRVSRDGPTRETGMLPVSDAHERSSLPTQS